MLHAVAFLGALGVVEAIQRANQAAGDAADALEAAVAIVFLLGGGRIEWQCDKLEFTTRYIFLKMT